MSNEGTANSRTRNNQDMAATFSFSHLLNTHQGS